jgi:hypothetical protein
LRAELRHFLVSGSSEGVIKVWEVPEPEENQLQPITIKQPKAEVNVDARITSVASAIVFDEIVEETQQYVTSHELINAPAPTRCVLMPSPLHYPYRNQAGTGEKKKKKAKRVKPTTRVVVEDEAQEEGNKKRKRGASPGPARKSKPGNSPGRKPQGKRPRNNDQADAEVTTMTRSNASMQQWSWAGISRVLIGDCRLGW